MTSQYSSEPTSSLGRPALELTKPPPADHRLPRSREVRNDIRRVVRKFPAPYRSVVANLAMRVPEQLDVISSSPGLAVALAHLNEFLPTPVSDPLREACSLIRRRQRDALAVLGFPPSESSARVVRKLVVQSAHPSYVRLLRRLLHENTARNLLLHVSPLTRGVLFVLGHHHFAPAWSPSLLSELANLPNERATLAALCNIEEAICFSPCFAHSPALLTLRVCQEVARVGRFFAEYGGAVDPGPKPSDSVLRTELPDSPIALPRFSMVDLDLRPITNGYALWSEATIMQSCVFRFLDLIQDGACFCYSLYKPERGTVMLAPDGASYRIVEAKGPCNRPLQWSTVLAVGAYLNKRLERMDTEQMPKGGATR